MTGRRGTMIIADLLNRTETPPATRVREIPGVEEIPTVHHQGIQVTMVTMKVDITIMLLIITENDFTIEKTNLIFTAAAAALDIVLLLVVMIVFLLPSKIISIGMTS